MKFQRVYNLISQTASNSLWNFCMCRVPILRLRLDYQINRLFVVPADPLKAANVDFADPFEPALGRFFQMLSEHVPLFGQRNHCESTDGDVRPGEQTRRDACSIPLVRENGAHDVLVGSDGHRSSGQPLRKFFCFAGRDRIFQLLRLDVEFNFTWVELYLYCFAVCVFPTNLDTAFVC